MAHGKNKVIMRVLGNKSDIVIAWIITASNMMKRMFWQNELLYERKTKENKDEKKLPNELDNISGLKL